MFEILYQLGSIDEAENSVIGKRVKTVSKRFREAGNTDSELKQIEAKKKRSTKKELKANKAQAQEVNMAYFISDLKTQKQSLTVPALSENDLPNASFISMPCTPYEELIREVMEDGELEYHFDLNLDEVPLIFLFLCS